MGLEDSSESISFKEAEKGLFFLFNGLPRAAIPLVSKQFAGYYALVRNIDGKIVQLTYEPPNGKGKYFLRNVEVIQ